MNTQSQSPWDKIPKDIQDFIIRLIEALIRNFVDFIIANLDRVDFGSGNILIKTVLRFILNKLQKWLNANQVQELEKLIVY